MDNIWDGGRHERVCECDPKTLMENFIYYKVWKYYIACVHSLVPSNSRINEKAFHLIYNPVV